jgi:hypothetical protein
MPRTNVLTLFELSYPILAKVQKPGGVTVLSAVGPGDVPNKAPVEPSSFTGTAGPPTYYILGF